MAATPDDVERPTTPRVWAALVAVYIVWGTTYFAIRIVNQTLPALLAASVRFLVAGALMYSFTIGRGTIGRGTIGRGTIGRGDVEGDRPGRRQWTAAAIVGLALLLGGNGAVAWAERTVPSSIVALIVALIPLWMALIDAVLLGRRPSGRIALGLLAGFTGAALLVGTSASGSIPLGGMLLAVGASLSWASGSLYARNAPLPKRPFVGIGMEMLCGGVAIFVVAVLAGDLGRIHLERVSLASGVALAYLVVFGSLVGFASYVWLLRNARTSLVSTYAYVNPVVAVFLGWAFLDEPVTIRTLIAGGIVVAAVAIIISASHARTAPGAASGGEVAQEPGDLVEGELALERTGDAQDHGLAEGRRGDLQPDG
jgi:drug/metabolite transporter (DMT)-like permease